VLVIGDSYIEGLMVTNEHIVHNALAKLYQNQYNFLNLALSNTTVAQQFFILKYKYDLSNTDTLIQFVNLDGDLEDEILPKYRSNMQRPLPFLVFNKSFDEYQVIKPREPNMYDSVGDLLGDYELYHFLKKSAYHIRDKALDVMAITKGVTKAQETEVDVEVTQGTKGVADMRENWLYLKGAFYQTNKMLERKYPMIKYKLVIVSKNLEYQENFTAFLDEQGIQYVILNDAMKMAKLSYSKYACDNHWDDAAHQNVAKSLFMSDILN
jgi:hypothetical protein